MTLPRNLIPGKAEKDGAAHGLAMKTPTQRLGRVMREDSWWGVALPLAAAAGMVVMWGATLSGGAESEEPAGRATVKGDRVPLYAQAAATGARAATLMRGEVVAVDFVLTTAEGAWCHLTEAGQTRTAGYVRCDDLEREPPPRRPEVLARPSASKPAQRTEVPPASREVRRTFFDAAGKGDITTLRALLQQGLDQETKDAALRSAVLRGRTEAADVLLTAGADVHHKDNNGQTCLYLAANSGDTATVHALLAAGADGNARTVWDETPLMAAALWGHAATVRALLVGGADAQARDQRGQTALIVAASDAGRAQTPGKRNSHIDTVRGLLAAGAEVIARDEAGRTALMYAARTGHIATIQALLAAGADLHARDNSAGTALREASEGRHPSVYWLLKEAGARQ